MGLAISECVCQPPPQYCDSPNSAPFSPRLPEFTRYNLISVIFIKALRTCVNFGSDVDRSFESGSPDRRWCCLSWCWDHHPVVSLCSDCRPFNTQNCESQLRRKGSQSKESMARETPGIPSIAIYAIFLAGDRAASHCFSATRDQHPFDQKDP